jgi:hypothetical protein
MRTPRLKTGAYKSKELATGSVAPSFSRYRTKGLTRSIAKVHAPLDLHSVPPGEATHLFDHFPWQLPARQTFLESDSRFEFATTASNREL